MSDDLEPLVQGMRRKLNNQTERIDRQVETIERLEERISELERVVDPDPGATDYHALTKPQKVHRVRRALVENAAQGNGRDALKYKAVMTLFDGHPSPGHCYDLMERAGEADGFAYDESAGGEKRIRVELDDVNDDALVHAANKASRGVTA